MEKVEVTFRTRKLSEDEIALTVSGSMTGDAVSLFEHALDALEKSSYSLIILDLSGVVEVSSLFVGHILNCHQHLTAENRTLRICGYHDSVGEVLTLLNVDKTIRMDEECPGS
jgi:anti-anti-sigma regulatory factor